MPNCQFLAVRAHNWMVGILRNCDGMGRQCVVKVKEKPCYM